MLSPCWGTLDVTAILMAATAWLMSFKSCIVCGFDSYTVIFSGDTWKSTVYGSIPHTIRDLKDNISHAVAAIKIAMLHRIYLDVISRAQLCIDAGGNHLQHLIWWYIISKFGYCINFCIHAMLRTRATFSWPTLYNTNTFLSCHTASRSKRRLYLNFIIFFLVLH